MNLAALPGQVLEGKYRIEKQLGKGGMGAVFLAIHLGTTRSVAIKVIVPQLSVHDEFLLRFQREAEAAGRLRHPNVVNVTDFGFTELDADGPLAYLVMEFLDGENLGDFLKRNPRPATDQILDIIDQTALALSVAHEAGIVHRDLKPDNIWLQPNHRGGFNVKVLDFGIAKFKNSSIADPVPPASPAPVARPTPAPTLGPDQETLILSESTLAMEPAAGSGEAAETLITMASIRSNPSGGASLGSVSMQFGSMRFGVSESLATTVGSVLGTPSYMAPEQCRGENVGKEADIYSLAVLAYQMFTGTLPFEARSLKELLAKQMEEIPQSPSKRDPGIPLGVSQAILMGLAKDPRERQQSAPALAAQLRAGAEAEVKLLADGKSVANTQLESFLSMLGVCIFGHVVLTALLFAAAASMAKLVPAVPGWLCVVAFHVVSFFFLFFTAQVYKAGSALLLLDASQAGHFRPIVRQTLGKLARGLPELARLHIRCGVSLRPRSFYASVLWPVVWAVEGLTGGAALERAEKLASVQPAASVALAIRKWSALLMGMMITPVMVASFADRLSEYVYFFLNAGPSLVWFPIVYPTMFLIFQLGYGPAAGFLYWSARRCESEDVEFALPTASRAAKSRKAPFIRPGTVGWGAVALLMAAFLIFVTVKPERVSETAFWEAAADGRLQAVTRALNAGMAVDAADGQKRTPLLMAAGNRHLEVVRLLISRGADVNKQNRGGVTPLLIAVRQRDAELVDLFLAHGAKPDLQNVDGRTALMAAAMQGDVAMVRRLLAAGADPARKDSKGKTARDFAVEEGHPEVAAALAGAVP